MACGRQVAIALILLTRASAWVQTMRTNPDGSATTKVAQDCETLAPGVELCNDIEIGGSKELQLLVNSTYIPTHCPMKLAKKSIVLLQYSGWVVSETSETSYLFESQRDFTRAPPTYLGVGKTIKGWDIALEGMCEGQKATLVIPPELAYGDEAQPNRPAHATLKYEIEVTSILTLGSDGKPIRPNIFRLIDTDGSQKIDAEELDAHFIRIGQPRPQRVPDDADGDGKISWDEFTGPKGNKPIPKDEL